MRTTKTFTLLVTVTADEGTHYNAEGLDWLVREALEQGACGRVPVAGALVNVFDGDLLLHTVAPDSDVAACCRSHVSRALEA